MTLSKCNTFLKLIVFVSLFLLLWIEVYSYDGPPIGLWKTFDDQTRDEKSLVEIIVEDGKLTGKIDSLFLSPDEDQNPLCDECKGERKDEQIIGMTILWNLKKKNDKWSGGKILDPENGKIYGCKLEVIENGNKLKIRGFLGLSLLGRTQYWEKVE